MERADRLTGGPEGRVLRQVLHFWHSQYMINSKKLRLQLLRPTGTGFRSTRGVRGRESVETYRSSNRKVHSGVF